MHGTPAGASVIPLQRGSSPGSSPVNATVTVNAPVTLTIQGGADDGAISKMRAEIDNAFHELAREINAGLEG
jgi:hypothetical protein